MEVPGVGAGHTVPDLARATPHPAPPPDLPETTVPPGDFAATLLGKLSETNLARLVSILESAPSPAQAAGAQELLQAALSAAATGDANLVLDHLRELARVDPRLAESLASEPELAPMRPAVEQLLNNLTSAARMTADSQLARATHAVETANTGELAARGVRPDEFLIAANRLIEAGGLYHFVQSAKVSNALIEECRWAPAPYTGIIPQAAEHRPANPPGAKPVNARFLLLLWVSVGVAGGLIFLWIPWRPQVLAGAAELWAVILLLLVGLDLYTRHQGS